MQVLSASFTSYGEVLSTADRSELLPVAQTLVIGFDMDVVAKSGMLTSLALSDSFGLDFTLP